MYRIEIPINNQTYVLELDTDEKLDEKKIREIIFNAQKQKLLPLEQPQQPSKLVQKLAKTQIPERSAVFASHFAPIVNLFLRDDEKQYLTELEKQHPVSKIAGEFTGAIAELPMFGLGVSKATKFLPNLFVSKPRLARFLTSGIRTGLTFGAQGVFRETVEQAKNKTLDLGKIGERYADDFLFGAGLGMGEKIVNLAGRTLASGAYAGLFTALQNKFEKQKIRPEDVLLNTGIVSAFTLLTGKLTKKQIQDEIFYGLRDLVINKFKAQAPLIEEELINKTANDFARQVIRAIYEGGKEKPIKNLDEFIEYVIKNWDKEIKPKINVDIGITKETSKNVALALSPVKIKEPEPELLKNLALPVEGKKPPLLAIRETPVVEPKIKESPEIIQEKPVEIKPEPIPEAVVEEKPLIPEVKPPTPEVKPPTPEKEIKIKLPQKPQKRTPIDEQVKENLIKKLKEAYEKAPEIPREEDKFLPPLKINGEITVVNSKEAIERVLKNLRKMSRTYGAEKKPYIREEPKAPYNKLEKLVKIEGSNEYFTDGMVVVSGKPPSSAKFGNKKVSIGEIEKILNQPTTPVKIEHYFTSSPDMEGISKNPLIMAAPKNFYNVAFSDEYGNYYFVNQAKLQEIISRYPNATFGINNEKTNIIAYVNNKPVGAVALLADTDKGLTNQYLRLLKEFEESRIKTAQPPEESPVKETITQPQTEPVSKVSEQQLTEPTPQQEQLYQDLGRWLIKTLNMDVPVAEKVSATIVLTPPEKLSPQLKEIYELFLETTSGELTKTVEETLPRITPARFNKWLKSQKIPEPEIEATIKEITTKPAENWSEKTQEKVWNYIEEVNKNFYKKLSKMPEGAPEPEIEYFSTKPPKEKPPQEPPVSPTTPEQKPYPESGKFYSLEQAWLLSAHLFNKIPQITKLKRNLGFYKAPTQEIKLSHRIFANDELALYVYLHETGHGVEKLLIRESKRSNILGKLAALHNFTKWTLGQANKETVINEIEKVVKSELGEFGEARWEIDIKQPNEMYADFFSLILMKPDRVMELAPVSSKLFWEGINKNPEVSKAITTIMMLDEPELIKNINQLLTIASMGHIQEEDLYNISRMILYDKNFNLKEYMKELQLKIKERIGKEEVEYSKQNFTGLGMKLKTILWDTFAPLKTRLEQLYKEGKITADEYYEMQNVMSLYFVNPYSIGFFTIDKFSKVIEKYEGHFTLEDLGTYLIVKRIINPERVANPMGITPANAPKHLEEMKLRLGTEKFQELEQCGQELKSLIDSVMEDCKNRGLIDEDAFKEFTNAERTYVPIKVEKYLEEQALFVVVLLFL